MLGAPPFPNRRGVIVSAAAASAASLFFAHLPAAGETQTGQPSKQGDASIGADEGDAIRPFKFQCVRRSARGPAPADCRDEVALAGTGDGRVARRAARDDARTRALLADRLRLAQGRSEAERLAAIHDDDRRGGHSFHSRSFETSRMRCRSSSRTGGPARSSSS